MEPESPDDRPESPKKKIRPSSTTNSEVSHSDSQSSTDLVGTSGIHSEVNGYGLAPTRSGRNAEACSSSEVVSPRPQSVDTETPSMATPPRDVASIQEEVVSSSESSGNRKIPVYNDGNADSLTGEVELVGRANELSSDSEAERKEL